MTQDNHTVRLSSREDVDLKLKQMVETQQEEVKREGEKGKGRV